MISIVVAMTPSRVIGRENALPWRLKADLKHFKAVTVGKPIIMGRKTFESIGKPLPHRRNIVLTRDTTAEFPGAEVVHSVESATLLLKNEPEVMVIGGGEIYRLFLPKTDRLYLTLVNAPVTGDVYFPEFNTKEWQEVSREHYSADAENEFDFDVVVLDRRR
ncbi:MAG: type 3 dihydrofolate reductase [Gammaproteobacteria bacterium]|nr:type 3 dihydrofolate reductase [Gammaproteobacteria bacterium]